MTYYVLRGLAAVGLVRDLRLPPPSIRDAHLSPSPAAEAEAAERPEPAGIAAA